MGSTTPTTPLPSASSPSLTLTLAHPDERPKTWSLTHPMWGPALSHSEYLAREHFMTTLPLAKDGGLTHWILTDTDTDPSSSSSEKNRERPILSSCETLRKHAVAARYDASSDRVVLTEGISHGIGSVFTDPQYRGKGYANRMMQEVGRRLRNWQVVDKKDRPESESPSSDHGENGENGEKGGKKGKEQTNTTLFSVLYSDIGKSFYAKNGWRAFPSAHVSFKPIKPTTSTSPNFPPNLYPISYHTLPPLCTLDTTHLLTQTLPTLARLHPSKTHVALLPDLDCLLWHLLREDFMTQHIFHRTPTIRGAIYSPPDSSPNDYPSSGDNGEGKSGKGKRVWAVWTRSYYRGLESESIEGNHMHILRFVMEGVEDLGDEESLRKVVTEDPETEKYLVEAFRAIMQVAQREAAEWRVEDVQMWNPSPLVSRLIEQSKIEGGYEMVERDMDSIPSLMWYGAEGMEGGRTEDVEWVANEKYGWC